MASSAPKVSARNAVSAYPTCSRNDSGPQVKKKTAHSAAVSPAWSWTSRWSRNVAMSPAMIATAGPPIVNGRPVETVSRRIVKGNAGRNAHAFWAT
ncbi:hypothetical protein [Curtobacterium sp. MCPF17_052]|uniref:hypothetical protein n=1 Tax=Curtobacterium sp. MCPF17_052 TaxID=2175655 RepID=UPI003464B21C